LKAVSQDGKTFARELWKVVVGGTEDQYQKNLTITPAGPGLVYDLARPPGKNRPPLGDAFFRYEHAPEK
jgi:hypothetical protein